MSARIVVDPVTRIEGHLRIEAELGEDGHTIREAYASGTMVRGIETILKGRDPRDAWAFTQRICGVCTLVHALASVRAVEDALHYPIPPNAQLIRNLMIGAQFVQDHVMHFYHLHALDWVDVVSALQADPEATAALARQAGSGEKTSPAYFSDVRQRLRAFVEGGQLGIFAHGYWGHPAYRLPPEANLMAVAHYLEALPWQREAARIHTLFGGKNPHPNFTVGGVPCAFAAEGSASGGLDLTGLAMVREGIRSLEAFVRTTYLPDVLAIAGFYPEWSRTGEGVGNFLSWGEFPADEKADPAGMLFPRGAILGRDVNTIHPVDPGDKAQVQEFVRHAWYDYSDGNNAGRHPHDGETRFREGAGVPAGGLAVEEGYSWLKSPRWRGHAMEVGPLARMLLLYASGHPQAKELVGETLRRLNLPLEALFSTLGRTAARALESLIIVQAMDGWLDRLLANLKAGDRRTFNDALWDPATWPAQATGVGLMEAPRGGLGHWVVIRDGRIANYQAVVPTTWNAGPRDAQGQAGPYEAALRGLTLHDPERPVEILRTIHSFDPCIACAVHLLTPDRQELLRVRVR